MKQTSLFSFSFFNIRGIKQHGTQREHEHPRPRILAAVRKQTAVGEADWKAEAVHLQGELELQQLRVAGGSVTEEFGIIWVPLNSLAVMSHG